MSRDKYTMARFTYFTVCRSSILGSRAGRRGEDGGAAREWGMRESGRGGEEGEKEKESSLQACYNIGKETVVVW